MNDRTRLERERGSQRVSILPSDGQLALLSDRLDQYWGTGLWKEPEPDQ